LSPGDPAVLVGRGLGDDGDVSFLLVAKECRPRRAISVPLWMTFVMVSRLRLEDGVLETKQVAPHR